MKRLLVILFAIFCLSLLPGCGVRVYISDTRLRGPVPSQEELALEATARAELVGTATPTASAAEANVMQDIISELESLVGEDLVVVAPFSGRETPNAGPRRGMRVEPGDTVRISAGRSQDVARMAGEYCIEDDTICSRVWVHGRPGGGSQGAWYPIVVFEYPLEE